MVVECHGGGSVGALCGSKEYLSRASDGLGNWVSGFGSFDEKIIIYLHLSSGRESKRSVASQSIINTVIMIIRADREPMMYEHRNGWGLAASANLISPHHRHRSPEMFED